MSSRLGYLRLFAALAFVGALAIGLLPSSATAQSFPQLPPGTIRPVDPVRSGQEADRRGVVDQIEAEEQRRLQEERDRMNAAERTRRRSYDVTCDISSVSANAQWVFVTCDNYSDVYETGDSLVRDLRSWRTATFRVDLGANPAFANAVASIATAAHINRRRVRIEAYWVPAEDHRMLSRISFEER